MKGHLEVSMLLCLECAVTKVAGGDLDNLHGPCVDLTAVASIFWNVDSQSLIRAMIEKLGSKFAADLAKLGIAMVKLMLTERFFLHWMSTGAFPVHEIPDNLGGGLDQLIRSAGALPLTDDKPLIFTLQRFVSGREIRTDNPGSRTAATFDALLCSRVQRLITSLVKGLPNVVELRQLLTEEFGYSLGSGLQECVRNALILSLVDAVDANRNDPRLHQRDDRIAVLETELRQKDQDLLSLRKELSSAKQVSESRQREFQELRDSFLCPICLDSFMNRQPAALTDCGHCFCSSCLEELLLHNARQCPMCKKAIISTKKMLRLQGL
jgi:hypothetical protein